MDDPIKVEGRWAFYENYAVTGHHLFGGFWLCFVGLN